MCWPACTTHPPTLCKGLSNKGRGGCFPLPGTCYELGTVVPILLTRKGWEYEEGHTRTRSHGYQVAQEV